ncbi:MAG: diadenylate cyclase [Thermodesulfobacteriota bacterium]
MSETINTIFSNLRVQDVLDILIISLLLYGLLVWFTKAASRFVLGGVALLGIVYILSKTFQLYLTAMVLQGFFAILLVALVVIFQEELRRFFERLATWRQFRNRHDYSTLSQEIEVICQVSFHLSEKRMGALMVLCGREPIGRHVEGGVSIYGSLSEALLESLFDKHSPGHDGAVLIDYGKVLEFGAHLPLSSRSKEFGLTGLRHTAALGLAEKTDALCVVVSEETGDISVAKDGSIQRLANPNELRDILALFFAAKEPGSKRRPMQDWFQRNFWEKAAAIILAMILWVVFGQEKEIIRRDFVLPIEYRNLSDQWVMTDLKVLEAKVNLAGSSQAFSLLDPSALKISVDLSNIREGEQTVVLSKNLVKVPPNLTIESIKPSSLEITAHRLVPVMIPIEVRTTGSVPQGYSLTTISVSPPAASVLTVPNVDRNSIKITTKPIDLSGLTQTTFVTPGLLYPADARFYEGKPPDVKVALTVRAATPSPPPKPVEPASAMAPPQARPATEAQGLP